jgi:UDP-glucose 4-epimerase
MRRNILIVGGGGFIGTAIAEHLIRDGGNEVHCLAPSLYPSQAGPYIRHRGGQDDERVVEPLIADADVIIHTASKTTPGESMDRPSVEAELNLAPTLRFLEILNRYDKPMLFFSSGGTVYGDPIRVPIDETHPQYPVSYYGAGKVAIEAFICAYATRTQKQTLILRPSNVYGPGQMLRHGFGVISTMLGNAFFDEETVIWGDGQAVRDFVYIGDLLGLVDRILEKGVVSGTFNVGSGEGLSLNGLVKVVEKVCQKRLKVRYEPPRAVDIQRVILDSRKISDTYGWTHLTPIESGIRNTWAWLKARL